MPTQLCWLPVHSRSYRVRGGENEHKGDFTQHRGGGWTAAILSLCAMLSAHVHMYSSIATLYACTDVVATTSPCPMLSAPTLVLR